MSQPGLQSEHVISPSVNISEATFPSASTDPQTRFPIPNERQIRRQNAPPSGNASRKILFQGDPSKVHFSTDLPFKPPGLQWQGVPAVTTRQLQEDVQNKLRSKKAKSAAL